MLKRLMLATAACALASAVAAQDAETADVTRDTVVATVNGTDITLGEVIAATARLPAEYQQLPPEMLFQGMIDQLVQQQLLAETIEGVPARVAIVLANEERSLLAGEAINALLSDAVSDADIQSAYDERYNAETAQQEYSAAHILVDTEEEAQAALERIEAGEDFATVAAELSQDPGSAGNGGDLGWFLPTQMVEPFGDTVAGMEPGAVSDPVETQFGWHVILLNESRQQALPPLDFVRPQIEGELQQAAVEGILADLQDGAEITRAEEGAFDPALVHAIELLAD